MNGRMGSKWRENPSTIMQGYGSWSDMKYTRSDGKKFVIPANIVNNENKTKEIIAKLKEHDSATEALYKQAE